MKWQPNEEKIHLLGHNPVLLFNFTKNMSPIYICGVGECVLSKLISK